MGAGNEHGPEGPEEPAETHGIDIFVTDPSVEAEGIAQTLRALGYVVVDVPLAMLLARAAVQRPRVVLLDADAEGAREAAERLRDLQGGASAVVFFLGARVPLDEPGPDEARATWFFRRPVDVEALTTALGRVTPAPRGSGRMGAADPSGPTSSAPASLAAPPGLPPPSMRSVSSRPPPSRGLLPGLSGPPSGPSLRPPPIPAEAAALEAASLRSRRVTAPLSAELAALLHEAEARVGGSGHDVAELSPDEEVEAVLPAEILASLDEPLDDDDARDDEMRVPVMSGGGRGADPFGPGPTLTPGPVSSPGLSSPGFSSSGLSSASPAPPGTLTPGPGSAPPTAASGASSLPALRGAASGSSPPASRPASAPPTAASRAALDTKAPPAPSLAPSMDARPSRGPLLARMTGASHRAPPEVSSVVAPSPGASPTEGMPRVLGPGDGARALATVIAARATGTLVIVDGHGAKRRVSLREGDVVGVTSDIEREGLLPFLGARGDLPKDAVSRLTGRVPAGGRHAGAALVAHGLLRQDHLWDTLRAHAQWILGRLVLVRSGTAALEDDAPEGRGRHEPGAFGATPGAGVFVEVVRRAVDPQEAVDRLGGPTTRLVDGAHPGLLEECGLDDEVREMVARGRGRSVGDVMSSGADVATVLHALVLLGVLEGVRAPGSVHILDESVTSSVDRSSQGAEDGDSDDALEEGALRARVRARSQLVDEGDYFAVLGVAPDATGYEIRRAFLDLRRSFEPVRVLSPRTADLADDVRRIVQVLEEAYEVLRDDTRRDRYRRAIADPPRS